MFPNLFHPTSDSFFATELVIHSKFAYFLLVLLLLVEASTTILDDFAIGAMHSPRIEFDFEENFVV
ncbi:hypothetical protein D3C87_2016610 [compost metagenome]